MGQRVPVDPILHAVLKREAELEVKVQDVKAVGVGHFAAVEVGLDRSRRSTALRPCALSGWEKLKMGSYNSSLAIIVVHCTSFTIIEKLLGHIK